MEVLIEEEEEANLEGRIAEGKLVEWLGKQIDRRTDGPTGT